MRVPLWMLCFSWVLVTGCATLEARGPITGKMYVSFSDVGYQTERALYQRKRFIEDYLNKHPNTPANIKAAMLGFKAAPGLDREQLTAVVGKPTRISGENSLKEEWLYAGAVSNGAKIQGTYCSFENGILILCESEVERYVRLHPALNEKIKNALLKSVLSVGMTKEEVRLFKGEPYKINKSVGSWGTHEQWLYGQYGLYADIIPKQYLYFENDKLSSWQEDGKERL